ALLTLAFEILADEATHEDPNIRLQLIQELAKASGPAGMVGGQAMDLAAETTTCDLPTTTRLQQLKTGALLGFCIEAGAIMGKAGPEQRSRLRAYAHDLGLAFQIADDLLDAEGSSARTGKAVAKDVAAGKATVVSLLGVGRGRPPADFLVDQAVWQLGG